MSGKLYKLLEWLERAAPLLETQVVGSGFNKTLNDALRTGLVDIEPHPTVKDGKAPAAGIVLTDKGRGFLHEEHRTRALDSIGWFG